MCSSYRDRPDHRSTPFRVVTVLVAALLCAVLIPPVCANSAVYFVSENGTSLSAEITMVDQDSYILSSPGFLGEGAELKANNVTLTAENGTVVNITKRNSMELTFPKGNYTLTYTAPIEDNTVYAVYNTPYNVTVFLPKGFSTNHPILGPVSSGGEVGKVLNPNTYQFMLNMESGAYLSHLNISRDLFGIGADVEGPAYETAVWWTNTEAIQMRFYADNREQIFYIFAGVWTVLFAVAGIRYLYLKKRANTYL